MRPRLIALVTAAAVAASGCGALLESDSSDLRRDPYEPTWSGVAVDAATLRLPLQFADASVIDPDWDTSIREEAGVFLGARESAEALEFTAVDATGNALWSVERPVTCSGFVVTTGADGTALAVINDVGTTETAVATVTATAYNLLSGDVVWGPVPVPGPLQGPGLVYGAPSDEEFGAAGPTVALDVSTGAVVVDEAAGANIVGEYGGTVLVSSAEALTALDAASGDTLWSLDAAILGADPITARRFAEADADQGYALLQVGDSLADPPLTVLVNLETAAVIQGVTQASYDPLVSTLLVRDGEGLTAYDAVGTVRWKSSATPSTRIESAGLALAYLVTDNTISVRNILTGELALAYPDSAQGAFAVPTLVSQSGAAVLEADRRIVLALLPAAQPTRD